MIKYFLFFVLTLQQESNVSLHVETASFDHFKDKLIPKINPVINLIDIKQEVDLGNLVVHEVRAHMDPIQGKNVKFHQTGKDSIHIDAEIIKFSIDVVADIKKFIHTSGVLTVIGQFDLLQVILDFRDLKKDDAKPQIDLRSGDVLYNPNRFKFELDFRNLPRWLADWMVNLFKSQILGKIIPQIVASVNQVIQDTVNQEFEQLYPLKQDLGIFNLGINTNLVKKPDFENNRFNFDIDGTFYKVENSRILSPTLKISEEVKSVEVNIGQKSFTSAMDIVLFNRYELKGDQYDAYIEATKSENYFLITKEGIFINNLEFVLYIQDYKFLYKVDSKIDLKFSLHDITKDHLILEIAEFNLAEFKCDTNFKFAKKITLYAEYLITEFIKVKRKFSLPMPKFDLPYNIQVGEVDAVFEEGKMSIDVSFIFQFYFKKQFKKYICI